MVKDILATMERPPDLPPSRSADYCTKKSFFQVVVVKMTMMIITAPEMHVAIPWLYLALHCCTWL